ncbi:MAG: homoserine O-acetyltransferase [Candidatus Micrarchaeota archaeon]|nr:homoserine O-acetyltransferase [Candidatus Micrarchaeota archaeon]
MTTYIDATYEQRITDLEKITIGEFKLSNGDFFGPVDVAYKTYGKLSEKKDNTIFVCHSISGDCHVSDFYPNSTIPGWWSKLIGPGKYIDTNKFFVICPNVFGGCYGTTGPSSINPKTGKRYGSAFPKFSLKDVVTCHQKVLEYLGITKVNAVLGGSFGGTQVLAWMAYYPDSMKKAIPIACSPSTPVSSVAFNSIVKRILHNDKNFNNGDYYEIGQPTNTIALSRVALELQFVSHLELQKAYGRKIVDGEFAVSKSMWEKSLKFAKRFDANSFLLMLNSMDNFDLGQNDVTLKKSLENGDYQMLGIAVSSDTLYSPVEMKKIINARKKNSKTARYYELKSSFGHDAFFNEIDSVGPKIKKFINEK